MLKKSLDGLRRKLLNSRKRKILLQEKLLQCFVKRIISEYSETAILLFGSRAISTHMPYSDYDIAVIFEKVDDKISLIEKIRKLKPRGLSLDLIVFEKDELSDPLIAKMLEKAKILYDKLGINKLIDSNK